MACLGAGNPDDLLPPDDEDTATAAQQKTHAAIRAALTA